MTSLDVGIERLRHAAVRLRQGAATVNRALEPVARVFNRVDVVIKSFLPKGLYARSLLIIIAPMVILQSVVAFVFMERHWNSVTRNLSAAVVQDIAALIDIYRGYPQ